MREHEEQVTAPLSRCVVNAVSRLTFKAQASTLELSEVESEQAGDES